MIVASPVPTSLSRKGPVPLWKFVLLGIWILAAGGLAGYSVYYENRPGEASPAPRMWPTSSHLARSEEATTLVVFLHPECGCSQATFTELKKLLDKPHELLRAIAVFAAIHEDDQTSDLVKVAESDPNMSVVFDQDKQEQAAFGAKTSGLVLVYNPKGELQFEGGVTSRRGHVGDNFGLAAVREILEGRAPAVARTSVFGCHL